MQISSGVTTAFPEGQRGCFNAAVQVQASRLFRRKEDLSCDHCAKCMFVYIWRVHYFDSSFFSSVT